MKSIIRFGVLAVVFALLISAVGLPVHAQGAAPNMCFDLKADDCKLLTDGFTALAKVTSTNFSWGINVKSDGVPQGGTLDLSGKGSLIVPATADTGAAAGGNPMAGMMGSMATAQFQTTIDSKGAMGPQDLTASLEIRVTGGSVYLKSDKLTGGKWKALKLSELSSSASAMVPGMSGAGGAGAAGGNPMSALTSNPELFAALLAAPNIPGVIKVTRDADQDASDKSEKYAQFTYTLDLATLVKAKEFLPVIKEIAKQAMAARTGTGVATAPAVELTDEQAAQFVTIVADALKDVKIQAVVAVGLDSKTVRGLGFTFAATLDPKNTILGPMLSSMQATGPVTFNLSVFLELSSLGKADAIEVPADAEATTIAQLMQGMMGGMMPGVPAATPAK